MWGWVEEKEGGGRGEELCEEREVMCVGWSSIMPANNDPTTTNTQRCCDETGPTTQRFTKNHRGTHVSNAPNHVTPKSQASTPAKRRINQMRRVQQHRSPQDLQVRQSKFAASLFDGTNRSLR